MTAKSSALSVWMRGSSERTAGPHSATAPTAQRCLTASHTDKSQSIVGSDVHHDQGGRHRGVTVQPFANLVDIELQRASLENFDRDLSFGQKTRETGASSGNAARRRDRVARSRPSNPCSTCNPEGWAGLRRTAFWKRPS